MSYINPRPAQLDGDDITYDVSAGGKPSTATPKDKRLKVNKTSKSAPAKPGSKMYPTMTNRKR